MEIVKECQQAMAKRMEALDRDLAKVRTGRASVSILDGIRVNYYGTMSPLNQVASLSTPDARTILIAPFEKKLLQEIEKAIQMADIGIQPNNDGNNIRLPVPQLNEERRKELAKTIKKIGEDAKVSVRQTRQDFNTKIKKLEKDKKCNEDESTTLQKEIQTLTDKFGKTIDDKVSHKQAEIMKI